MNKAPKILIFGLNTLCGILSNCTWKNAGIKINFLCILLFYEFLMYFFVFSTFVFVLFFGEICGRHFLKHNNAKTLISAIESKISIFIFWTMRKNSICIDFVHKITFWNHFRSDVHTCTKSYVTSEPYPWASQIWCQNVRETRKKKVIKYRGESFAHCRVIARNVKGGLKGPPPPPVFLGLRIYTYQEEKLQCFQNPFRTNYIEQGWWHSSFSLKCMH